MAPEARALDGLPSWAPLRAHADGLAQRTLATLDATLARTPDIHAARTPEPPVA